MTHTVCWRLKQGSDAEGGCSVVELLAQNQSLEIEVTVLRQKLAETNDLLTSRLPADTPLQRLIADKTTTTISPDYREIVPRNQQTGAVVAHYAAVLIGRITGLARPSVRLFICMFRRNKKTQKAG